MKIRNEFQIGLVGLVTLVILFLGIKFLKGTDIFSSNRNYYAIYDNVSGMHESSYIYINGLKAGYVKKITPMDKLNKKFLVEIAVDKKLEIPKDSRLTLFSDGLLGGKALRIDAGVSNIMLSGKDTIIGYIENGMMDGLSSKIDPMMTDLSSVIKRIDTLTAAMNNTFNSQSQENIRQTLNNINSVSKKLDHIALNVDNLIDNDKQKLDNIVTNIETITENILSITDSIDGSKIAATLNDVNSSLTNLNSMLKKIEKGNGNLGQFLNDEQLYNNLTQSTKSLNELIEDIKKNPKKYINVRVF
ncbi:MAG: MCE family protein [Bacteroidales bacterium]|nr:MCE family protein [Bacteroidales bacterium]